jgi:hypothetical protein
VTDTLLAVRGIENLSPAGRRAVIDIARSLGVNPDFLVTVMSFESAGTFDPAKKNAAGSGAVGLIQFMPQTAFNLGTTSAQLAKMSQDEQIRGPVYHYFQPYHGRLHTLDDTYLAVFFPAAIGQSDDYVVGQRDGGSGFQQAVYKQNQGFDWAGSGFVRKSDIVKTIRSVYNAALGKPRVEVPGSATFRTLALFGLFGIAAWGIIKWGSDK